jgi:hypothetical protein
LKDNKIDRNIYYYDIAPYYYNKDFIKYKDTSKTLISAFEKIKEINTRLMKSTENKERETILKQFCVEVHDDKLYVFVDKIDSEKKRIMFRMVLCRQNAFPYIEQDGYLKNISSVVSGEFALAEVTHCVIFADEGIMGGEFNFNGARPSAIATYLPEVVDNIKYLYCAGKIRTDVFDRLVENKGYCLFELSIKNSSEMKATLRDNMGIFKAFRYISEDVDTYEVMLKTKKSKKKKGFNPPIGIEEMRNLIINNREDIKTFKVSQTTITDSVDLLHDKMVCKETYVLTKNKEIDGNELYGYCEQFFDECIANS